MIAKLFGELSDGRIGRLHYLGYSILVAVIALLFGVGLGVAVGVTERVAGIEAEQMQTAAPVDLGGMGILLLFLIGATLFFVNVNLMAKRARDIGLSGWTTVVVVLVIAMIISLLLPQYVAGAYNLVVWIGLLLIPTGALAEKSELL